MDDNIKIKFVEQLLADFGQKAKSELKKINKNNSESENLNIEQLDKTNAMQSLKIVLRHIGVNREWLKRNGFVIANLILRNFD